MAASLPLTNGVDVSGHDLLDQIGNTPLVYLRTISAETPGVEIFVKDESRNPGGSVKDRPALNMILDGERAGDLTRDKIILDATSGNTGIAYAMIGAARGYRVRLCLPENASPERKRILKAYGAEIVFTDPGEGSDGAIRVCREIYADDPDAYFYPDQYNNPANWKAHFETHRAGDHAADRRAHHALRRRDGNQRNVHGRDAAASARMPAREVLSRRSRRSGFHGLEGLKHMPTAIVPGHLRRDASPTTTSGSRPKTPTRWCAGWPRGRAAGGHLVGRQRVAAAAVAKLAARGERTGVIVTIALRRRGEIPERTLLGR